VREVGRWMSMSNGNRERRIWCTVLLVSECVNKAVEQGVYTVSPAVGFAPKMRYVLSAQ
jgi:hypothetical protein